MEEAHLWYGTAPLYRRFLEYTRQRKMIIHTSHMRIDCPAFKKWHNFPTEINSSSLNKHKHIRSPLHYHHIQSIKFGIGQVDIRMSTYEHLRLLWWLGLELQSYLYQTNTEEGHLCYGTASLCGALLGYTNDHSFQLHADRLSSF